jgi:hypothetical protein
LQGSLSASDRVSLLREGAKASARYLREGGRLADIQWETCSIREGRIHLLPVPPGPRCAYPDRQTLEKDLERLQDIGRSLAPDDRSRLRFVLGLIREWGDEGPAWRSWLRNRVRETQARQQLHARYRYGKLFQHSSPDPELKLNGLWVPDPRLEPMYLHTALLELPFTPGPSYHQRRAEVIPGQVLGTRTVVKRFTPNPRSWRRKWEVSRARRAWCGACILQELGIPCTYPLGWLEVRKKGRLQESYFISRELPVSDNARVWLRRVLPGKSAAERIALRHRLRWEIETLHRNGLAHRDLKLSNLMVRERPGQPETFYWIDLEDLRPEHPSLRTFLRNLYQLNGSLPRQVTRGERIAFARGFQHRFPSASRPLLHAVVEHKTRRRLRRELKRLRGP